ncbi:MAG: aldo/keto reductase [Planctomycetota bacterium]|jgi:diketogulonate reductase-like aldo/keto reductase|nr:aldo/keto reductase [Planctomycetota bacterium]
MAIDDRTRLNNGVDIPSVGLGVFRSHEGKETEQAVAWALEAGYRHIDTAKVYKNEKSVGAGLRASGVPRKEVFLTTKIWNDDMRDNRQLKSFEESLEKMGVEYIDLYLIHWPVANFLATWQILEEIHASGRAKAIGVSNFQIHHLDKLLPLVKVKPAVDQVELHPYLTQLPLRQYLAEKNIAIESWSPLGGQGGAILRDTEVAAIAASHHKSPAQVIIRWNLQNGIIVIPKSVHKERIVENANVYDFELTAAELARLNALNRDRRFGPDPENFNF